MGSKQIIVLGPHRSGTSMVAGILHHLGVFMGEDLVMGNMPEQPTGYFEDREFLQLNERILSRAGGGWQDIPDQAAINSTADRFSEEIADLIGRRSEHKIWGWKDPRTCLTLPLYLRFLSNPHIVIVQRDYLAIKASLIKREKGLMDSVTAAIITETYLKRIFSNVLGSGAAPFPGLVAVPYSKLAETRNFWPLIYNLRLVPNANQIDAARNHIKPELDHWQSYLSSAAQEAAPAS